MKFKTVHINKNSLQIIENESLKCYPLECCGFLVGQDQSDIHIEQAIVAKNIYKGSQKERYEIDPRDYILLEKELESTKQTILGVFHSHPDHPAKPSSIDLQLALPFFTYLIISVSKGTIAEIKSWKLSNNERIFNEQTIVIV